MTTQPTQQTTEPVLVIDETHEIHLVKTVSRGRLVLRRFLRRKAASAGLFVVFILFFMAYVGIHFTHWGFTDLDSTAVLQPPSGSHWFGTDGIGEDLFAQTMRGLQKSLLIGLIGALLATGTAAVLGGIAGYYGGVADRVVVLMIDLLLILPAFLIIAVMSPLFAGKTWLIFVLLLAAFGWMLTGRVVRGLTQSLKEREFVSAARFMGVPGWKIILRHILPNMASFLIVDATINVAGLILAEVGLTFFGFGIRLPEVSLGTLISQGIPNDTVFAWLFYFPAVILIVLALAVNLAGDGLRDALDPNSEISGAK